MIIYKDIITGKELFSDNFPMKLIDNLYYEVEGETVPENSGGIDDSLIGGNKSAEEPTEEEFNPDTTYGCNIVINHRLQAAAELSKKDYSAFLKPYLKKVVEALKDKPEDAECFKSGITGVVKKMKEMWKDLLLYVGEDDNEYDGMICFLNYRDDGKPYMVFFKHGLVEEKV